MIAGLQRAAAYEVRAGLTGIEVAPIGTRGLEGLPAMELGDDGHDDDGERVLEACIEWRCLNKSIESSCENLYRKSLRCC